MYKNDVLYCRWNGSFYSQGSGRSFMLGSGRGLVLVVGVFNGGDDSFLPALTVHLPPNIHYVKVLPTVSTAPCVTTNTHKHINVCLHTLVYADTHKHTHTLVCVCVCVCVCVRV